MIIVLREEAAGDAPAREALLDRAFGPERFLRPSERLRAGRLPAAGLALAAETDGRLAGTVRLWHVAAGGVAALLLGPLAVEPSLHGRGVGAALMRRALNRAAVAGHGAVLLVGDASYYGRFGFSRESTRRITFAGPEADARLLGLELVPGALAGVSGGLVATGAFDAASIPLAGPAAPLVAPAPALAA